MPGGVLHQARARAATAAAALIEYHDAIVLRIEKLARAAVRPGARAAVQKDGGFACRVAALFIVELMNLGDPQVPRRIRFDRRIQFAALRDRCRSARYAGRGNRCARGGGCTRRGFRSADGATLFFFIDFPLCPLDFKCAGPRVRADDLRSSECAGGKPPDHCPGCS